MCAALRNPRLQAVKKQNSSKWNERFSVLYTNQDFNIADYAKHEKSESESEEEETTDNLNPTVSDLRTKFLENLSSDRTSGYRSSKEVTSFTSRKTSQVTTNGSSHISATKEVHKTSVHKRYKSSLSSSRIKPGPKPSLPSRKPSHTNKDYPNCAPNCAKPNYAQVPTPVLPLLATQGRKSNNQLPRSDSTSKVESSISNGNVTNSSNVSKYTSVQKGIEMFKRMESLGLTTSVQEPPRSPTTEPIPFRMRSNSTGTSVSSNRSSIASLSSQGSNVPETNPQSPTETSIEEKQPENVTPAVRQEPVEDTQKRKVYNIATELLTTEKQYVKVLGLIETFRSRVKEGSESEEWKNEGLEIPQETMRIMFNNSEAIYKFHHDFLLPQLEERMDAWSKEYESNYCDKNQKIGDIFIKIGPFLLMYTEYIKEFDKSNDLINETYLKNPKFKAVMEEIHASPECENLSLLNHMLAIIQRIPRYEMLFKDYSRKLPENSHDVENANSALKIITRAALHANEAIKKLGKFKQLLEIEKKCGNVIKLVTPTRELIKEGDLKKISTKAESQHQTRHVYLFNDMIIFCAKKAVGDTYKVKNKFELGQMQVIEGDSFETDHSFSIRNDDREILLYTETAEEKEEWLDILFTAIQNYFTRIQTLQKADVVEIVGVDPPTVQDTNSARSCAMDDCFNTFGIFSKGYNCKACGKVFCRDCRKYKHYVPYMKSEGDVCKKCFEILQKSQKGDPPAEKGPEKKLGDIYSGELQFRSCILEEGTGKLKSEKATYKWCILKDDWTLYLYHSKKDKTPEKILPVPGNVVHYGDEELKTDVAVPEKTRRNVIKMCHPQMIEQAKKSKFFTQTEGTVVGGGQGRHKDLNKIYYFYSSVEWQAERWSEVLKMATTADKPKDEWYSLVQELERKQQRTSRNFPKLGDDLLDSRTETRNSSRSPSRVSTIFNTVTTAIHIKPESKNKTLPRNYSASRFSSENQS